jgi:hypothetical protein
MFALLNKANSLMAIPSIADNVLNQPTIKYVLNPNKSLLQFIAGVTGIASVGLGWVGVDGLVKQGSERSASARHSMAAPPVNRPISSQEQQQNPEYISPSADFENIGYNYPDPDNLNADPWEENRSFDDPQNWIFSAEEELEHPALDYRKWSDELAILLYGQQGGGKTSKLLWLAEEHLKKGNIVLIVSPFAYSGWVNGIEIAGINHDYLSINQALNKFCNESDERLKYRRFYPNGQAYFPEDLPTVILICDEITSWGDNPELEVVSRRLVKVITQNLRQTNCRVYFGGHGNTVACLLGKALAGKKDVFNRQFTRIQTKAKQDKKIDGGLRCAGECLITYSHNGEDVNRLVKIPTILPSNDCVKITSYQLPDGSQSKKATYDFSRYKSIPFSKYHQEETVKRQELNKLLQSQEPIA